MSCHGPNAMQCAMSLINACVRAVHFSGLGLGLGLGAWGCCDGTGDGDGSWRVLCARRSEGKNDGLICRSGQSESTRERMSMEMEMEMGMGMGFRGSLLCYFTRLVNDNCIRAIRSVPSIDRVQTEIIAYIRVPLINLSPILWKEEEGRGASCPVCLFYVM
ncbi:hypothetical protein B0H34DRAFT_62955 [Crassisporium funariophilum]|nr:hypothetical protein B0H34DRAFT_62955 [Crassisporium funariophilum]